MAGSSEVPRHVRAAARMPAASGPAVVGAEGAPQRARTPAAGSLPRGAQDIGEEFSCFYREHFSRLTAYLVYQGASAHSAAELAQDAMIETYRRWDALEFPRAYAWTVAYRAFIRRALHEVPVAEVPEPTAVLPSPGDAESWLGEQEVLRVLQVLPPRQRQVLALTLDGWTPAEIASLLGLDPPAVRSSLMKARRSAAAHRRRTGEEES